jgi:hypothetical protein
VLPTLAGEVQQSIPGCGLLVTKLMPGKLDEDIF